MMAFSSDARAAIQPDEVYTADQMRAYAQEAVRAALASKPDARMHAREAASDAEYWTRNRSKIIDAIEAAGYRLTSNKDGFWLAPASAEVRANRAAPDVEGLKRLASQLKNAAYSHGADDQREHASDRFYAKADQKSRDALAALNAAIDALASAHQAVEKQPQVHPVALSGEPSGAVSEADAFLAEVRAELIRARAKFPGDRIMTIALAEEFGELCKAVLDEPSANVRKEAVQTAVMACRVALDGDGSVDAWRRERGLDPLTCSAISQSTTSAEGKT
jgi:hypothetical protein